MDNIGRIFMPANQGATGALFGVAMIAYTGRLYVQLRVLRRFDAEDWILLVAAAVLVACTGFYYNHMAYIYKGLMVSLYGEQEITLSEILKAAPVQLKTATILLTLWWVSIFGVKVAYLLFFRKLLFRLRGLMRWWWFVMGFLLIVFVINIVLSSLTCPYQDDLKILVECSRPSTVNRIPKFAISTSVLDAVSDFLIVSIPIALLWRARIAIRQKIGLGITLSLSAVMAILALIRIGGMRLANGALDEVWVLFWLQQECSVAVTMVSITAFRSLFVAGQHSTPARGSPRWYIHVSRIGSAVKRSVELLLPKTKRDRFQLSDSLPLSSQDDEGKRPMVIRSADPQIPSGTITGVRSALDKAGHRQEEPC